MRRHWKLWCIATLISVCGIAIIAVLTLTRFGPANNDLDQQAQSNQGAISEIQGDISAIKNELGEIEAGGSTSSSSNPATSPEPEAATPTPPAPDSESVPENTPTPAPNPENPGQKVDESIIMYSADVPGEAVARLQTKYQEVLYNENQLVANAEELDQYFGDADKNASIPWIYADNGETYTWKFISTGKFEEVFFHVMWECYDQNGELIAYTTGVYDGFNEYFYNVEFTAVKHYENEPDHYTDPGGAEEYEVTTEEDLP